MSKQHTGSVLAKHENVIVRLPPDLGADTRSDSSFRQRKSISALSGVGSESSFARLFFDRETIND